MNNTGGGGGGGRGDGEHGRPWRRGGGRNGPGNHGNRGGGRGRRGGNGDGGNRNQNDVGLDNFPELDDGWRAPADGRNYDNPRNEQDRHDGGHGRGHNIGNQRGGRGQGHRGGYGGPRAQSTANADPDGGSEDEDSEEVPRKVFKKRERKFEGPVFGFKRLYRFLETEPSEVILSINRDKEDWKLLLESDELTGEKLIIAIQVLGDKVCVDEPVLQQPQTNALTACCSKLFAKKLEDALPKICNGSFLPYRRNAKTEFEVDCTPLKVTNNIHQFCSFIVKSLPNASVDYFQTLICTAMGASAQCDPNMDLFKKFKDLTDQIKEFVEREQKKQETIIRQRRLGFDDDDLAGFDSETPPDSIKDIEVIPNIEELRLTSEPFLRPNKKIGAYNDADHYIDVQFRLLREDFVRPLRQGIRTFLKERHEYIARKKRMPLGEVRLYTEVTVEKIVKERDSVVYKLKLAEVNYKKIKWEKSKRLLIGSLIVLTTTENSFQPDNTHFGVVFSRNVKELEKGIVTVLWESSPPAYNEDEEYLMFESEVYLEAYRHTLETLKKLELTNFPMKKFIVEACSSVDSPKYLKNAASLLKLKLVHGEDIYISPQQWQWPSAAEFGLDENQLQAFKAAITKEFSIIQGPPGTGKTFLGLKVAEVLLNNAEMWKGESGRGNPITVVCYTNHALDQFLEGILKYYEREDIPADIIRIGGRCKSEVLAKYSLRDVRNRNRRKLPQGYWTAERIEREKIYELESERASRMSEVTGLQDLQGIVDFEKLSAWSIIQTEYPKVLWNHFQKLSWFGIGNEELKKGRFSEDVVTALIHGWFQVRNFPKVTQRKAKNNYNTEAKKVDRRTLVEDDDFEDEEDFDVEELLEHRIVDDILLEAETSQKINMGKRISYIPDSSISGCDKSSKALNRMLMEATRNLNPSQTAQMRESKRGEQLVLENRLKCLAEIFKLYKDQLLDLPDVSEILQEIRQGGPALNHLSRMRMSERWALYFAVVDQARHRIAEKVAETEKNLTLAQKGLRDIIQWGDGLILQDCKVVGLTTTGAAKYNNLLRMMKSKIVIVEEAAEVFEAHIVTCITENCEQLILIGDHRQLRPSPTVYALATRYHLDLSLFERMLNNNLHCYQLKMQHRMRPDIADLIVGPIYEELDNHESVKIYPDVKGVTKNVFFITHAEKESAETDSMSKSNKHEALFIAALCRYLILQGYDPDQITVLTMYTGQMFLLKKEIGNTGTCKGVRVTCVDNFQGEENDIILLSLVRSNSEGKIGFLSIDNRICVSLSRARHGLYVIGNMDVMVDKSKTWRAINEKLETQDAVRESLELECQIHLTRSLVKSGKDFFTQAPEGGCTVLCDTVLPCTHKCTRVCHVIDKEHEKYKCLEPCLKACANSEHHCIGKCFQPCPPCMFKVLKTLNCERQHKRLMPCHKPVDGIVCSEMVPKTFPCGHEEIVACHINIYDYVCKVKVMKELPCRHTKIMECYVDPSSRRCNELVAKLLPCEHTQTAVCWTAPENVKCETMVPKKFTQCGHEIQVKCSERNLPVICKGSCKVRLPCGHACTKTCHLDNDPNHQLYECKKPCSKECKDGHKCSTNHPCFKACPPCKERVLRNLPCGHQQELECYVNVNEYECLQVCERLLPDLHCRHKCPNLCYQPCGPCQTKVQRRSPCGHPQTVLCGELARKENCTEPVRPRVTPICGHHDTLVPCKYDAASPEELVKYCQKPCDHIFNPAAGGGCGHPCGGTCSTCLQGRIHMKCQNQCGRQLVCGHVCEVPCSSVCPPCQKPCLMRCEHSECKMKCGEPCSDCKEKCGWTCPHKRCNKLCGEMCDREPCNEPCRKKLKCDHECVGFCGEPCPPLCRICDREELTSFFLLGNEEDEDARFIYLEDCSHTIEVEGLEGWINTSGSGQITVKRCPKCKTTIRNCRRFGNLIREHYKDVMTVKRRAFGNPANIQRIQKKWITAINNDPRMERIFSQLHGKIRNTLLKEVPIRNGFRLTPRTVDEFAMRSLDFIAESADKVANALYDLRRENKLIGPQYDEVVEIYRKIFSNMMERQPLSRQEIIDFNEELDRLDYFKQLMLRRSLPTCNPNNAQAYIKFEKVKAVVTSALPFTESRKEEFKKLLKELDEQLRSGLGITNRERQQIVSAMGLTQGHWYKCPNGHVYVITECGGATVESVCNECGARIGGGGHRLRTDNRVATEMDGAVRPAWPQ